MIIGCCESSQRATTKSRSDSAKKIRIRRIMCIILYSISGAMEAL